MQQKKNTINPLEKIYYSLTRIIMMLFSSKVDKFVISMRFVDGKLTKNNYIHSRKDEKL